MSLHVSPEHKVSLTCGCAGRFPRDNCPTYLQPQHFAVLKAGAIDRLEIHTSTFMEQLDARKYSKVGNTREFGCACPQGTLQWTVEMCHFCACDHVGCW